jgi:hypothetical protein
MHIGVIVDDGFLPDFRDYFTDTATHWSPLPEAPNGTELTGAASSRPR